MWENLVNFSNTSICRSDGINPVRADRGGGIIRDHRGTWVQGFTRSIGFTISVIVKF